MRQVLLGVALLALSCNTPITDPNRWQIGKGEFPRFLTESEICQDQASYPLQPELAEAPMDSDDYRSCMQSYGWREQ